MEGRDTISEDELILFMRKKSVSNYGIAKIYGKKHMFILAWSSYFFDNFISNVFNLSSDQTLSNYDTLNNQSKDGLLLENL